MRQRILVSIMAVLLALAFGCSKSTSDTTGNTTGGKLDCPDCDPKGPNAFVQTGLGNDFYVTGEKFSVAHQALTSDQNRREPLAIEPGVSNGSTLSSAIHLFDYEVTGLRKQDIGNSVRDVVKFSITQGTAPANLGFSTERVDGHESKVELEMDDLLYMVSVTRFTKTYPLGFRYEAGRNNPVNLPGSTFPVFVPDASIQVIKRPGTDIKLDTAMKTIADSMQPGWQQREYHYFEISANSVVYWAEGHKWPFYIKNNRGVTLLVKHSW